MNECFIFDAIRTPRAKGKLGGELSSLRPIDLLAALLIKLKERQHFDDTDISDFVLGCVTQIGEQGGNLSKSALQLADYADSIAGVTLNRFCASGLESLNIAAAKIMSGMDDLILCGGVESMSRVEMLSDGGAWMNDEELMKKVHYIPQGVSADVIATINNFSRQQVDEFAQSSQKRAFAAQNSSRLKSVIPILTNEGHLLDKDMYLRPETSLEKLSGLRPAFKNLGEKYDEIALRKFSHLSSIDHVHHAGNSSGIVDGASLLLVGSSSAAKKFNLRPRAKIKSFAILADDPTLMLTAPAPVTLKALKKAGISLNQVDLFEVNEAFASVVLHFMKELNLNDRKINVNGGAIAFGHPLGATGGMLVGTILDELEMRDLKTGVVTLCAGGGMGIATVIERI
jgi:acetyl-CoA C-acetyltransferase